MNNNSNRVIELWLSGDIDTKFFERCMSDKTKHIVTYRNEVWTI